MIARLYARFSTERQDVASIADQLRVCSAFAAARAWRIASEHMDEAISGAAVGNRPGVLQVLAALEPGDALIVTDLTRLARSQDLAPLIHRLRFRGVRVLGAQDGFDSLSRTAGMQAGISGILSEEFRSQIADRTRSALELRARTGGKTGGRAYDDPGIVREIFERVDGGQSMREIANDLNHRGIPSPGSTWNRRTRRSDGRWLVSGLHAILRNERYAGREVWNRSQWVRDPDTGRRQRRMRPPSEWISRPCPALIDPALFDRVQARLAARRGRSGGARGGVARYLLSGLLTCAVCGSRLIVVGGSQHRYVCGLRHGGGAAACSNACGVPRLLAEDLILQPVIEDLLAPEAVAAGVRAMREFAQVKPTADDAELHTLERLVREGTLSADVAAPAIDKARQRAAERRRAMVAPIATRAGPDAWRAAVARMASILKGEDVLAARGVLAELIGVVPCRPAPEGNHLIAELSARSVMLQTGSGRWVGSGGAITIHLRRSAAP